jgi:hypothetical protein
MAAGDGTNFPNLGRAHALLELVEKHYSQVAADQHQAMRALGPVPVWFDGDHSISGGFPIDEKKAQKFYLSVLSSESFLQVRTGPLPMTIPSFSNKNARLDGERFTLKCAYGYPLQEFSEQITCTSSVKHFDTAGLRQWTAITYHFSGDKFARIDVASNVPAIREKGISLVKKKQNG